MGKSYIATKILWVLIFCFGVFNFIMLFVPEIGFDALWYHLTLPKLWLLKRQYYFSGGLLYYSVMPRLTELLFIPLIQFTGTFGPKLLQFLSGLGICIYLQKIAKNSGLPKTYQLIAVVVFYCTWLVSWESSSAYIDLFRSFLEIIALAKLLEGKRNWGAIFLGLALGTKWLALFSLIIYSFVFGWGILPVALLIASPWFAIAYHFTGNPVYPLFSGILTNGFQSLFGAFKNLSLAPFIFTIPFDDFISPLIGIIFILATFSLFALEGQKKKVALIGFLGAISTIILSPPSARFLLPYLPALIVACLLFVDKYLKAFKNYLLIVVILSAVAIFGLRLVALQKYVPYLLGKQTKNQFLTSISSKLPDTFIDSDNYLTDNLDPGSLYLIDNLHNLYYFPYNFDHTSWASRPLSYDYLITKGANPANITGKLVHTNQLGIQFFKLK